MVAERIQLRGICQCCGRQQAVVSGSMSKHGYEVKEGWFQGVCSGEHFAPMQKSRAQADTIVREVREECVVLRKKADLVRAGGLKPREAKSGRRVKVEKARGGYPWEEEMVPFEQAPSWHQKEAIESMAWRLQRRAEIGESFASGLEKLADEYYGKELLEVKRDAGPVPIVAGERRQSKRGVLIALGQFGAMVHWKDERGFKSKMSSRSWRLMPMAEAVAA